MNYQTNNSIDRIVSITLDGPSHIITERLNISISRPYFKHDHNKGKTYVFHKGNIEIRELSETYKAEEFKNSIAIEFFKESGTNISPDNQANEFYEQARQAMINLSLEVRRASLPSTAINGQDNNTNSEYIIFKSNKEKLVLQKLVIL